jgi:phosphate-selective porin OprO and OprP
MRSKYLIIGVSLATGLAALCGSPSTGWGQLAGSAYFADADSTADVSDPADGQRLPPVVATSASVPATAASTNARINELETQLAEIQTALQKSADDAKKPPKGYVIGSNTSLLGKFTNDGAAFGSPNGDFKWKMRGLVQLDMISLQGPQGPGITTPGGAGTQDSTTFRRLRIGAEGTMYETIDWVMEVDLAMALQNVDPASGATQNLGLRSSGTTTGLVGGPAAAQSGNTINVIQPTVNYLTFTQLPWFGNIRVGNQQDWISFEHIESARFLDFMERAPIMDAFNGANNNGYTPGLSIFNMTPNKKAALAMGVYKNNVYDSGYTYDLGNNNYTYGARATWTPYYDEPSDGRYMVHLGFGAEYRTMNTEVGAAQNGDNVRVRSRGDIRNTSSTLDPNFADTGNFYATSQGLLCPEIMVQLGPLLIQAEYEQSYFNQAATSNITTVGSPLAGTKLGQAFFQGGYVEALYFLTGENRQYNRQSGVFNRVVPFENAFWTRGARCYGRGAWQVGVRFDWLDLNSGLIQGGNSENATVGLNWFLNPNARFQLNYVCSWFNNTTSPLAGAATTGFLAGSRFGGDGNINSVGARLDFNF